MPFVSDQDDAVGRAEIDARFTDWLHECLQRAAARFGVVIQSAPIFGWRLRSISAPISGSGQDGWLRVVTEQPRYLPADFWTGNHDANNIVSVAKPVVLDVGEWFDSEWHRQVRAELMTRQPGIPCSRTDVLRQPLHLSDHWWSDLRSGLGALHAESTSRVNADQDRVSQRVCEVFGDQLDVRVEHWHTVHGDLHWGNLVSQPFALLDWEMWGRGPAGLDEATLRCYSLLVEPIKARLDDEFRQALSGRSGCVATVYAAARLLRRATADFPDIADVLHHVGQRAIDNMRCMP